MGRARALFLEKTGMPAASLSPLDQAISLGFLSPFDLFHAKVLSGPHQELLPLLCHFNLACKLGHLHLSLSPLNPSVSDLWNTQEGEPLPRDLARQLSEMIEEGAETIRSSSSFLVENGKLSLRRVHQSEMKIHERYHLLLETPPKMTFPLDRINRRLDELLNEGRLQHEQGAAIRAIASQSLTFITGGPGTGKTYTAACAIHLALETLPAEQKVQIAAAAPTGKAAANLALSLSRSFEGNSASPNITPMTLHRLLNIQPHRPFRAPSPLPYDILFIDESSMIDLKVMEVLLSSIRPGTRLVFLGDADQLPPVEGGALFTSMVAAKRGCVKLGRSMRTDSLQILNLANAINNGQEELVTEILQRTIPLKPLDAFSPSISSYTPQELKKALTSSRILSPIRKGPYGVETLNEALYARAKAEGKLIVPIMITRNSLSRALFNGDLGILDLEGNVAYFLDSEGGIREILQALLPPFEWAYALTVHKSQGSEFDEVALLLPPGAERFGREMFYTGVTRAKKHLEVYGTHSTVLEVVKRRSERLGEPF